MALFRKLFYRKPPDGLLEICERVYVFDCCFTTDALEEQDYKGYVGGIVTQLRENYPDASILAFNFREGDTQSQIGNVLTEYDMTIIEYPRHYEGCPLLPMEVIHHFLRSCESWFSLGLQNLLLMHCERGGWPVLAFMLAALLIYRKHYSGELKTLDMVYKQAPRELLQLLSPLNPMPSQLRYLQYVSRRNVATEWPPLDRALSLDCVIIRMIPNFDGEGGCRPIFRIYGQDPLVSDRSPKVLFSTRKKSRSVRHYKQAECEIVKVDINCLIQGDVVLECISLYDDLEREVMMFRVMFNTAFIRSNILMLNRDEIDVLWDAKDLFPKDFRAEVLFSEMDTAASMVPMDHSCFEEKDGLPVEAFAKVQEIFSSVDWLVPKGDAAVEALQHALSNTAIEAYSHAEKSQVNQSLAALEVKSLGKSSTGLTRLSSLTEQTDFNAPQIGMDKDVLPSEAETLYPKTSPSAIIEDMIYLQNPSPSLPLLIPEIPSASTPLMHDSIIKPASSSEVIVKTSIMVNEAKSTVVGHLSPSTTLSSNLNDIQVTEGGSPSPHVSSPITDATLKTTPPTPSLPNPNVAFVNENSASVCGPSPPEPFPPTSPFKENLECGIQPPPPASTPYLTDEPAANRLASSLLPSPLPPGPRESSSIKDGAPLLVPPPPPLPPSAPPLKDHYTLEVLPPLTLPLKDISVARPVPCPPPPPRPPIDSFSGREPTPYFENDASSLTTPLRDNLVTGPVPGPPSSPPQHPKERFIKEGPHFPQPPSGQTATNSQTLSPSHFPPPLTSPTIRSSHVPQAPLPPGSLSTKSFPSVTSAPPPPLDSPSTGSFHFAPSAPPPPLDSPSTGSFHFAPSAPPPPLGIPSTRSSDSVPSAPSPPGGPSTRSSPSVLSAPPPLPGSPSTKSSPSVHSAPSPPPDSLSTRSSPSVPSAPPHPPGSPSTRSSPSVPPPPPDSPSTSGSPSVPSAPPPPPGSPSTRSSPSIPSAPPAPPGSPSSRSSPSVPSAPPGLLGSPSPPPPSNPPPGTKGKSLLSRTITSKNSQTKKLKPLHWLKISRAVSGSMWAEAQKSGEASRAPEIDMSELESLFSAAVPNPDQGGSGRKTGSRASMCKPEKVQLIEHRRAYNCEIMLSKVKTPLHDMLSSVLALEDSSLDVDQVDNLIKFCPTKEEMELLKGYKGDRDKLGKCEQFFLELMQVPRIEQKLRVYSFKIQFFSQVSDLRNNLTVVNSAADQIRGSSQLKRIMQTILSLGNALNQGTARGSAVGFKLDSLLKLTDTRARNNKMTLMHYLCKVLSDKLPELLYFWKDLSSLELASKIQLKFLAEEMQAVNKGLEKVVQELSMAESDGPVSEQFCKALKEFLCYSEGEVRSLALLYAGVGRNVDSLILYFGEDPARCPFEQVISTLLNFVRMFKQAHEENCKQIEFEKKKAEKEAAERMKAEKEVTEKMKSEEEGSEKTKKNDPDTGHLSQSEVKSIK